MTRPVSVGDRVHLHLFGRTLFASVGEVIHVWSDGSASVRFGANVPSEHRVVDYLTPEQIVLATPSAVTTNA